MLALVAGALSSGQRTLNVHARPVEMLASQAVDDRHAAAPAPPRARAISGGIDVAPDPQLADMKIAQHRGQAAEMIFVRVRQERPRRCVSARAIHRKGETTSSPTSIPGAHAAHVAAAGQAAAVHQHGAAVGEGHKDGVALAHVEDGDFQAAAIEARRETGTRRYSAPSTEHAREAGNPRGAVCCSLRIGSRAGQRRGQKKRRAARGGGEGTR